MLATKKPPETMQHISAGWGISLQQPQCDYKTIDTNYYLPIVLKNYFVNSTIGQDRTSAFLKTNSTILVENFGLTYADLALIKAEKIMNTSTSFTTNGAKPKTISFILKKARSSANGGIQRTGLTEAEFHTTYSKYGLSARSAPPHRGIGKR